MHGTLRFMSYTTSKNAIYRSGAAVVSTITSIVCYVVSFNTSSVYSDWTVQNISNTARHIDNEKLSMQGKLSTKTRKILYCYIRTVFSSRKVPRYSLSVTKVIVLLWPI